MQRNSLSAIFGRLARERRLAEGLTQEDLAERAGVHPTYVGLIERGKRNPSIDIARELAKALRVPLSQLILEAERELQRADGKGGRKP